MRRNAVAHVLLHMYNVCIRTLTKPRHNLARLRTFLNLSQQQMADLVERHWRTIQSVELSKGYTFSETLARRIVAETGVQLQWLINNDLTAPIVDCWGHPYRRSEFEYRQATKRFADNEFTRTCAADHAAIFYRHIRAILLAAAKKNLAYVATWRIEKVLDECRHEFGPQKYFERVTVPLVKDPQRIEGAALMRKYTGEHAARMRQVERTRDKQKRAVQRRAVQKLEVNRELRERRKAEQAGLSKEQIEMRERKPLKKP